MSRANPAAPTMTAFRSADAHHVPPSAVPPAEREPPSHRKEGGPGGSLKRLRELQLIEVLIVCQVFTHREPEGHVPRQLHFDIRADPAVVVLRAAPGALLSAWSTNAHSARRETTCCSCACRR